MSNNLKIKKIIAASLIAMFLVSMVIYKIYAGDKASSGNLSSEKSNTEQTTATKDAASEKAADYESIFKKDSVIDIKINIAEEDWKAIIDEPLKEEYKSADITVNGTTVNNVGFRTKGNLTLRSVASSTSDRYSFRIKMNEYVQGQKLLGLDEFVINNMYSDPSYLREYLSYEALREIGANVPEAVFANIYINDKLFGFYLCVEAIDDSYLERSFGNNDGSLYKQEQGSTLQYSANSNYDKSELKNGDDETKADLKNFIKVLNEMPQGQKGDIEKVLDVDSALKYIAANTVLGNYDSYNGSTSHNYYLYGQEGKFTVLPWDFNMSIAGFSMGGGDQTTIPIDEPVFGANIKNLPLINNLLAVEEYKTKYHGYVEELVAYLEKFESRVTKVSDIIRPYVEKDPTKFYTMEQFEASIKYSETNATISANLPQNGDKPNQGQNQMPQGQRGGFQEGNIQQPRGGMKGNIEAPPQDRRNGDMQIPPQGGMDNNMQVPPEGRMGGRGAGGPGMSSGSIINYVRDRITNIKKQLSGELPTTGNTTMNNNMMGGNRNRGN